MYKIENLSIYVLATVQSRKNEAETLVSPIEHCIKTRWTESIVDWNGSEPLL